MRRLLLTRRCCQTPVSGDGDDSLAARLRSNQTAARRHANSGAGLHPVGELKPASSEAAGHQLTGAGIRAPVERPVRCVIHNALMRDARPEAVPRAAGDILAVYRGRTKDVTPGERRARAAACERLAVPSRNPFTSERQRDRRLPRPRLAPKPAAPSFARGDPPRRARARAPLPSPPPPQPSLSGLRAASAARARASRAARSSACP